MVRPTLSWLTLTLACLLCTAALAQSPPRLVRGEVLAVDGHRLEVRERSGETLSIELADDYAVSAVVPIDRAAIKPGSYVGTASMPQPDGTQRSLEVLVFPESGRGNGEGHYPWDLKPGSMMTNATVATIVDADKERRMTLRYKGGETIVTVPADAPIVTFEPADRSLLAPGAHVVLGVTRRPDGSLAARRVSVGKNGLVPPM